MIPKEGYQLGNSAYDADHDGDTMHFDDLDRAGKSKGLSGWFLDCETIEQLNKERSILISVINTEYGQRKQEILRKIPSFKRIPMIFMEEVPNSEFPVYAPFPKSKDSAPSNAVVFNSNGEISY